MPVHDGTGGAAPEALGEDERPPILGSWRNLYILALSWLAVLIIVFYFFTEYFS